MSSSKPVRYHIFKVSPIFLYSAVKLDFKAVHCRFPLLDFQRIRNNFTFDSIVKNTSSWCSVITCPKYIYIKEYDWIFCYSTTDRFL